MAANDPAQSFAVSDASLDARDNQLAPCFQYGRIETVSIAPLQRWRGADSGVVSYASNTQIIFYFETGGAAFLNPKETYMTFTFSPVITNGDNDATQQCALDPNTDALFQETQLQINGSLCEHLLRFNLFQSVINLLEKQPEWYVAVNQTLTSGLNADQTFSACLTDPQSVWFGGSTYMYRQGAPLGSGSNYAMAYHPKSFFIGQLAEQYFPLSFVNQLMYTMILETGANALKDVSYITDDGTVAGLSAQKWDFTIKDIRLHYTLVMVQDDVAAAIQKAYLSNGLPDIMHAIKTYSWQKQPIPTGSTSIQLLFTLSGTSYDKLILFCTRDADYSNSQAATLTNFPLGVSQFQVKVNGNAIPASKIETKTHGYELFRQLGYAFGKVNYRNAAIPIAETIPYDTTTGAIFTYEPQSVRAGGNDDFTVCATNGYYQSDEWNAPTVASTSSTSSRQQGCSVVVTSLSDVRSMAGQNTKGGIAIRGGNVQVEMLFPTGTLSSMALNLLAMQDGIWISKGTTNSVLT